MLRIIGNAGFVIAGWLLIMSLIAPIGHAQQNLPPPYCVGNAAARASWEDIAESTNRTKAGTLFYHSTAMGFYRDGTGSIRTYRPQVWLQSGVTDIDKVVWRSAVWTHCRRYDGGWYWQNHFWDDDIDQKVNTHFIQEYGPDVDAWDLGRWAGDGTGAKCRAEAGGGVFFIHLDTLWNVYDDGLCNTYQYVGNGP